MASLKHHDIMLSSSFKDLEEHRKIVKDAIIEAHMFPQAMELDSARHEDIITSSLEKVRNSQAYVGIIGYRYGQVLVDTRNPKGVSVTELEYDLAEALGHPTYMFVMSDKHPIPRSAVNRDNGTQQAQLEAFRKRFQQSHISATFDSVDDLKYLVAKALDEIRANLETTKPTVVVPLSVVPADPEFPRKFQAVPPYTPGHKFTGRVKELQQLDDWAVTPSDPVLVLEAIGGMGKSMLSWQWVKEYARKVRPDFAGIFWYSFYERGAEMNDFCRYAMAYVSGRKVEEFQGKKTTALMPVLIEAFGTRPWLVVLDGLERVLVAYNRYDAAQVRDEEVEGSQGGADAKPVDCIRPADADLLRQLAGAGPSKFLVSSRLMPSPLLGPGGLEREGVAHVKLMGLDPADAEGILTQAGVKGDSAAIRRYLDQNFGCHPLVVGVVAGLVRNYGPAMNDFDKWAADPDGGASINPATMDLVQRRNHILKFAFDALGADARMLLAKMGMVSESVDFETLLALNSSLDKKRLNELLVDLEARGLIQWDRKEGRFDLHPVVRGYAVGSLTAEHRMTAGGAVVDHFASKPHGPYEEASSLADLSDGLQVVRTMIHLGMTNQAADLLFDISNPLSFNLEAHHEFIEVARPLFPRGLDHPPEVDNFVGVLLWANVTNSLAETSPEDMVQCIRMALLRAAVARRDLLNVWVSLGNLGESFRVSGRAFLCDRLTQLMFEVSAYVGSNTITSSMLEMFYRSAERGDHEDADRRWQVLARMPRPSERSLYRPGDAEVWFCRLRLQATGLNDQLISQAEETASRGRNRQVIREMHEIRGQWRLQRLEWQLAADSFDEAISMAREAGLDATDCELRRAFTLVHLGEVQQARDIAGKLGDSQYNLELAELFLELGETESARKHIGPAYKRAWADGPPYVYGWQLQRCRKVLEALGDPEPQLPPFDASKYPPFPFEEKLRALLDKVKAEKATLQSPHGQG